jgi:hypothetical protein
MYSKSPSGQLYDVHSEFYIQPGVIPDIETALVIVSEYDLNSDAFFRESSIIRVFGFIQTNFLQASAPDSGALEINALYENQQGIVTPATGLTSGTLVARYQNLPENTETASIFPFSFTCIAQQLGLGGIIRITAKTDASGDIIQEPKVSMFLEGWF